jgi:hypothetical protein
MEEKLDDIGARRRHTPRRSLKRLAQETGGSKCSARRATELIKLRPYEATIQPCGHVIQLSGFIFAVGFYRDI